MAAQPGQVFVARDAGQFPGAFAIEILPDSPVVLPLGATVKSLAPDNVIVNSTTAPGMVHTTCTLTDFSRSVLQLAKDRDDAHYARINLVVKLYEYLIKESPAIADLRRIVNSGTTLVIVDHSAVGEPIEITIETLEDLIESDYSGTDTFRRSHVVAALAAGILSRRYIRERVRVPPPDQVITQR